MSDIEYPDRAEYSFENPDRSECSMSNFQSGLNVLSNIKPGLNVRHRTFMSYFGYLEQTCFLCVSYESINMSATVQAPVIRKVHRVLFSAGVNNIHIYIYQS